MGTPANAVRSKILESSRDWAATAEPFQAKGETIEGDLDLSVLDLSCPLEFVDCEFAGDVLLSSTQLRALTLRNCTVHKRLDLQYAAVTGCLLIDASRFKANPSLSGRKISVKGDLVVTAPSHFAGSIDLAYAVVEGSIVLNEVEFGAAGDAAIVMTDASVAASIEAREVACHGQWDAAGLRVGGVFDLSGARLTDPPLAERESSHVLVKGCSFYADRISVAGDLFLTSGFSAAGETRLLGARIGGDLACWESSFSGVEGGSALTLGASKIMASVFFTDGMKASGEITIVGCDIEGKLKILGATLNAGSGASAITINQTKVSRALEFGDCAIEGQIDFSRSRLGLLDLRPQKDVTRSSFTLAHTRCEVLRDDIDAWTFRDYDLIAFVYETLQEDNRWTIDRILQWLRKAQAGQFSPQPYEQLAQVQRRMGFTEYATEVSIERARREAHARKGTASWWRCSFDWLYGHIVAFGYRPSRALNYAAVVWVVGALLISVGHENGAFYRTKGSDTATPEQQSRYPRLYCLPYSAEVMVPFLRLRQEEFWAPNHATKFGVFLQYYLWLHALAGWLFGTFLIASVTSLVRKQ